MHNVRLANPGASVEAIQHHYDVGNAFYRLWLDPSMSYSAACWADEHETFVGAQQRKLEFHVTQARAQTAPRVLDIGCGWGAWLKYLVDRYPVEQAVGLTLSQEQAQWIDSYHEPRIDVRLESWSDHTPIEPYDAMVCVGAFEHFARPEHSDAQRLAGYRAFFQSCHAWLRPGGWMSLETITYENMRRQDRSRFLLENIYPESDLPTLADIAEATERLFELVTYRNDRADAARTWRVWLHNLKAKRAEAVQLVGEEKVATYETYLKFSIIAFHIGNLGLPRMALKRIDRPRP